MNKFMGGLTLGIIATTCFFIFFKPFQRAAETKEPATAEQLPDSSSPVSSPTIVPSPKDSPAGAPVSLSPVNTKNSDRVHRDSLVSFAKSLLGTPYLYGSADPAKGFDCSGFITHVFNHFNIAVPRSSFDFGLIGKKRTLQSCQRGDLILFTGTNPQETDIGHIGLVCDIVNGQPSFIHSSSGKANGVTITSMDNEFYQARLVNVIDLLSN